MVTPNATDPVSQIQNLPADTQKQVAIEAMRQLGAADQKDVVKQAGLPAPGQAVADRLWLLIAAGFIFVLVGSFISLAAATFLRVPNELLLTVFTTVAAFLAGLLAPSPVSKNS